jgi:hypothetical protein
MSLLPSEPIVVEVGISTTSSKEQVTSSPTIAKKSKDVEVFLNLFSLIRKGEDVFIDEKDETNSYIFVPSLFSKYVWSYLDQHTKNKNLFFIREKVNIGIASLQEKKKKKEKSVSAIYQSLTRCVSGLENLKINYKNDRLFCCSMDNIIDSIKSELL